MHKRTHTHTNEHMHFAKKSLICKHWALSCTYLWTLAFHHPICTMSQSRLFIFCLLFAFLAKSTGKVCVSDKDRKAQRNVLTDSSQQKQNDHNEQHTLLSYCMTAIFESCYDFELFPSTEMLINPVGCGSAEVLLRHLDVLCLGQSRWTDRCISKRWSILWFYFCIVFIIMRRNERGLTYNSTYLPFHCSSATVTIKADNTSAFLNGWLGWLWVTPKAIRRCSQNKMAAALYQRQVNQRFVTLVRDRKISWVVLK